MILGSSELVLLNGDPIENSKTLHQITGGVEMMLDGDSWSDEDGGWAEKAAVLKSLGYSMTIHPPAWDCNVAAGLYSLRHVAQRLNIAALEVCKIVGARQMVFHTGYCDRNSLFSRKKAQSHSMDALYELIDLAKPLGITIAVENVSGPATALYSQDEYAHVLDGVDETAQYLVDIGHANLNGWDIPALVRSLSPRLCGLHIHDNDGSTDQHLAIGEGSVPWDSLFAEMERLRPDCHFILEYAPGTELKKLRQGAELLKSRFA